MSHFRIASACAAVLACAALAGCASGKNTAATPPVAPPGSPSPASSSAAHPFTGRRTGPGGPVLAVKIDNTRAAKPQSGLQAADIVYVEQVEGGLSRILAVYSSRLPAQVGPVRSARISDLHILPQFGRPAFAYSGVQSKMRPNVARASLIDVNPGRAGGAYTRGGPHPAPYNLYGRPGELLKRANGASPARDIGFRFGPAPEGGRTITTFSARYPAARLTFTWSSGEKRWLAGQDGGPARAGEGGRLGGQTVVVQYAKTTRSQFHDFLGNYTPLVQTVGTGRAVVLRDGRAYDVRWDRPSESAGTTFTTAAGRPMTFAPGQVWVVLVNPGGPVTP